MMNLRNLIVAEAIARSNREEQHVIIIKSKLIDIEDLLRLLETISIKVTSNLQNAELHLVIYEIDFVNV